MLSQLLKVVKGMIQPTDLQYYKQAQLNFLWYLLQEMVDCYGQ